MNSSTESSMTPGEFRRQATPDWERLELSRLQSRLAHAEQQRQYLEDAIRWAIGLGCPDEPTVRSLRRALELGGRRG